MAKRGGFGGGMPNNMNNLMKQAQKMQKKMQEMQEDLDNQVFEASAGGGAVTVTVTGKKEVTKVNINPEVVDEDDVEMLEDLILAAVNEAMRTADEKVNQQMSKVTGGLNMPGLF
ncbi:YbaB/EbfC family nucleoid-associated protein [Vallitalea sp.]|jgi:DNA-binding YbaB/EbfC family protein|uniref:YbaB/EbfC family nucleoid-associated protein n=1 Tax=Vallitalea sp. TaxID=1882829 RepID=UPI0025DFBE7C|nr:YbaB/EbfC family nucleoid-associated protein [Vallitalea sp.]MCT4687635.1 YbaB/EbfC family nucleoid-associated protein [Vallitalea sp.]